jgi:hypothetical protein
MQIFLQVNFAGMFDLARSTYSMILEERDMTNLFPHIREIPDVAVDFRCIIFPWERQKLD